MSAQYVGYYSRVLVEVLSVYAIVTSPMCVIVHV